MKYLYRYKFITFLLLGFFLMTFSLSGVKAAGDGPAKVIKQGSSYYAAKADGTIYCPSKETFKKIGKYEYYIYTDGRLAVGKVKIDKKNYYFTERARLAKNKRAFKVDKQYYNTDADGVMTKISKKRAKTEKAAQKFIKKHSKKSMSKKQKFKSCFRYMQGNMRYSPDYFKPKGDYKILDRKEGACDMALSMFNSSNLRGNCHRFACCTAVIASELGYTATVVVTKGDHSFVMIDGKYYDNMYGGLFGAKSRPSYEVYKKFKFK